MAQTSQLSLQDQHSTGTQTNQGSGADLDLHRLVDGAIAPSDALLALVRLLGRQAARRFLRGAGVGAAISPVSGEPSRDRSQNHEPTSPQAGPPSDPF